MKKVNKRRYGSSAYIQLENNRWLKKEGILLIGDLDKSTTWSAATRKFLGKREKEGMVTTVSYGLPKSFIVYEDGRKEQIYLSVFAPEVLKRRL